MFINHTTKQVTAKIVYYGPGLSGKTTNLHYIFSVTNPSSRGELVSIETDIERTLFFDLLPMNVGLIKGYNVKFQLYTVPGQIFYDSTRKLVLKGADGVVFVADSQELMKNINVESYENLKNNMEILNLDYKNFPLVLQYNKRDLKSIIEVDEMNKLLNERNVPFFEAIAINGTGVIETLREISSLTLVKVRLAIDECKDKKKKKISVSFDTLKNKKDVELREEKLPIKVVNAEDIHEITDSGVSFEKSVNDSLKKIESENNNSDKILVKNKNNEDKIIKEKSNRRLKKEEITDKHIEEMIKQEIKIEKSNKREKKNKNKPDLKLDILNKLEDRSRITIIKKLKNINSYIRVEIKNDKGEIIDYLDLSINPDVKKVNIILDV